MNLEREVAKQQKWKGNCVDGGGSVQEKWEFIFMMGEDGWD
jgi:hypothetical protein